MSDGRTLAGVKKLAMEGVAQLSEPISMNGLEKLYWEHVLKYGGGTAGTGAVDSVNGKSGVVVLTADDVGAYTKAATDSAVNTVDAKVGAVKTIADGNTQSIAQHQNEITALQTGKEDARSTGSIGASDDPTTKPEGDYYVTEKFVNPPTLPQGSSYVGVMRIDLDFDGSNNGGLIVYYTETGAWYKTKFAGGWASQWHEFGAAAMSPMTARVATDETSLSTLDAQVTSLQQEVDKLKKAQTPVAPHPSTFNPATVELTGGFADNWQDAIHVSTHKVGSPIQITKVNDDPHNAVVMMDPEAAKHVAGITIDHGLPAMWESHAVTIGEKHYTAYISPYKFTKHPLEIGINWK